MPAGPRTTESPTSAVSSPSTSPLAAPWIAMRRIISTLGPTGAAQNARRALDEHRRAELDVERALDHVTGRPTGGTAEPRGA